MATVYKYPQWLMPENSNQNKVSNYSFEFDGVDDQISLPDIPFLRGGGQHFSISAWVYTTHITQAGFFGSRVAPSVTNAISLYRNTNRQGVLLIQNSSTGNISISSSSNSITTNNWHHVVATFDGTQTDAADRVNIYIDGVLDNAYQVGTGTNLPSGSTGVFNFLGRTYLGIKQTGKIDNLAIWDSTLTAGNVTTLYNSGEPVDITTLSPVAGWKLGEAANFTDNWLVNNSVLDNYSTRSFNFDGVDDYINMGNPTDLQITGALSISAWVKFTGDSGPIVTKSRTSGGVRSYGLWGDRSGSSHRPEFFIYNSGTAYSTPDTGARVDDGNWHHLLAVFNPSTYLRLYIDGNLEQENTTSIPATIDNDSVDFYIGSSELSSFFFTGNIDEVAVWNSDQSSNVSSIYNSGTHADLTSFSPVSWWRMGENATFSTNWTVPDQVGSNDGTSANMTIDDRVGEAPNSTSNSLSYNMVEADRETDVPS